MKLTANTLCRCISIPKEATLSYDDNNNIIIEVNVIKDFNSCTPLLCYKENRIIAGLLDKLHLAKYYKSRAKLILPKITERVGAHTNSILYYQIDGNRILETLTIIKKE